MYKKYDGHVCTYISEIKKYPNRNITKMNNIN